MKLQSFWSIVVIVGLLLISVVSVSEVAAVEDSYREKLPFEEVKLTRQISGALQSGNYDKLKNALKLMNPVVEVLNKQYPSGDSPRTFAEDIKSAIASGNDQSVTRETVTFLYFNLRDLMRLGLEFVKANNTSRAQVYVKKTLLIYKTSLQPFIQNASEKGSAIRTVSTGIQKMNQSLTNKTKYKKNKASVIKGLRRLFPFLPE